MGFEYQIDFSSLKTIQGQPLTDFVVECSFLDSSDDKKSLDEDVTHFGILNVDGSTKEKHKGAGFILEDLDNHQYAYAMKFYSPLATMKPGMKLC